MSELSFKIKFQGKDQPNLAIPVEIRRPNLSVAKRCLSTDKVSLDEGEYFVSTRLLTGQEISTHVVVQAQGEQIVELNGPPAETTSTKSNEHFLSLDLKYAIQTAPQRSKMTSTVISPPVPVARNPDTESFTLAIPQSEGGGTWFHGIKEAFAEINDSPELLNFLHTLQERYAGQLVELESTNSADRSSFKTLTEQEIELQPLAPIEDSLRSYGVTSISVSEDGRAIRLNVSTDERGLVFKENDDVSGPRTYSREIFSFDRQDDEKLSPTISTRSIRDSPAPTPISLHHAPLEARLRLFKGNVLRGEADLMDTSQWPVTVSDSTDKSAGVSREVSIQVPPLEEGTYWIQLLQTNKRALNVALPVSPSEACNLLIRRIEDEIQSAPALVSAAENPQDVSRSRGRFALEVHLANPEADVIMSYRTRGWLKEIDTAMEIDGAIAQKLLAEKITAPIGAAVGGYALLRLNQLDRLHDWTGNLYHWFPWLPDGAVIYGEHLARVGKHAEAMDVFLSLEERGLPLSSDGFSFAVDRLKFYLQLADSNGEEAQKLFTPAKTKRARALHSKLCKFTKFADFSSILTCFSGVDPTDPDSSSLPWSVLEYGGLDISGDHMDQ